MRQDVLSSKKGNATSKVNVGEFLCVVFEILPWSLRYCQVMTSAADIEASGAVAVPECKLIQGPHRGA